MKKFIFVLLIVLLIATGCMDGALPEASERSTKNQPVATINSIAPETAAAGQKVIFKGNGANADGSIVAFSWRSDRDGELSKQPQFDTVKLSPGKHTIFFKVQDKNGVWSTEVQKKIEITGTAKPGPAPGPAPPPAAPSSFAVVKVADLTGPPSSGYPCPTKLEFSGSITTNGPGTVTYRWERSDGVNSPTQSKVFYGAYAQTVSYIWQVSGGGDYWVRLRTLTPNDMASISFSVSVTCRPNFVTEAVAVSGSASGIYKCPFNLNFSASLTVEGPGKVTYVWVRSDGVTSPANTITFSAAETRTVNYSWRVSQSGEYWAQLYTTAPNVMKTPDYITVTITCE